MRIYLSNQGFTLMEVLVALSIFLLGIVGVMALLTTAISTHKKAVDLSNSTFLAENVLSDIKNKLLIGRPLPQLPQPAQHNDFPSYRYAYTCTDIGNNEVFIHLCVYNKQEGKSSKENFYTIQLKKMSIIEELHNDNKVYTPH